MALNVISLDCEYLVVFYQAIYSSVFEVLKNGKGAFVERRGI